MKIIERDRLCALNLKFMTKVLARLKGLKLKLRKSPNL